MLKIFSQLLLLSRWLVALLRLICRAKSLRLRLRLLARPRLARPRSANCPSVRARSSRGIEKRNLAEGRFRAQPFLLARRSMLCIDASGRGSPASLVTLLRLGCAEPSFGLWRWRC